MKHLFYTTSRSAWQGIAKAMQSANRSIYIEMYIFLDDIKGDNDLIPILIEKARAGIPVKMILDSFGSTELSGGAIDSLRDAGVEILFFKRLWRRLHRKIVIVDEKIGFIGGVNIHKSAENWQDLFIRIEDTIVHSLIRSFRKTYMACGGTDEYLIKYRKSAFLGKTRIWLLEHVPSMNRPKLKTIYTELIKQAEHSIKIATPYFIPDRWLISLLEDAVKRGVRVEIIVPEKTDIGFITRVNRRYMLMLSEFGVMFFLIKKMNHSKLILVDDKKALVGSQNIDSLSFDFNNEVGLLFDDPKMIDDLEIIVSNWRNGAVPFNADIHISFFDRILSPIVRFFQPFL